MKIAIATDNDYVSEHFGRCPSYTIFEIEQNKIISKELVHNPGHEPGKIPEFLNNLNVKTIIAGGMGPRAVGFFDEYKINVITGITGSIENVISDYTSGKLTAGESTCTEGGGKGYGLDKNVCDHEAH
ncbi:MAG: NifB/NifX family molybdenum-iron cluster-binding protein [Candidatus Margulisbacteria bacterium]|nr:NifB/NifX family molybdenum-iron cluster-binding protein [Candidatus Margulisiibacteriota bacterium]